MGFTLLLGDFSSLLNTHLGKFKKKYRSEHHIYTWLQQIIILDSCFWFHSIIYIEQMTLFALISSFWSSETSIKMWILNYQIYIVGFWTVYVLGLLISMLIWALSDVHFKIHCGQKPLLSFHYWLNVLVIMYARLKY